MVRGVACGVGMDFQDLGDEICRACALIGGDECLEKSRTMSFLYAHKHCSCERRPRILKTRRKFQVQSNLIE